MSAKNSSKTSILGSRNTAAIVAVNKQRRFNKRDKAQASVTETSGSHSAQKRRRYFANKRNRLNAINDERDAKNLRPLSLRTMPKITPPARKPRAVIVNVPAPVAAPVAPAPVVIAVNPPANKPVKAAKIKAVKKPKSATAKFWTDAPKSTAKVNLAKKKLAKAPAPAKAKAKPAAKAKAKAPAKKVKK